MNTNMDNMLTSEETAERLGLSRITVLHLARRGILEGRKIGGKRGVWLFDEDTVGEFAKRERKVGYPKGRPRKN